MRARVVGLVSIGVGSLAVVCAAAGPARSWVPLSPAELPLDESFESESLGDQVTYLDPVPLTQVTSEGVSMSLRVLGDEDIGEADDDTAVWEYRSTTDDANGTLVATSTTVVCLDRRSAEAVDCGAESVDGERVDVRGLTVRFPADTGKRDYDLWDTTVRQPFPARFVGTGRLEGLQVYRFEQEVPAQVIRSVPVPGDLVGSSGGELSAEVVYSNTRTLLVEPVSGVILSTEESPTTALRAPGGAPGAVLLAGTFRSSDEAVEDAVARAAEVRHERSGLRSTASWAAGGTGAVLVAAGLLLVAGRRGSRTGAPHDTTGDDTTGDDTTGDDTTAQDGPARVAVPSA